jgi:hypothetical protein
VNLEPTVTSSGIAALAALEHLQEFSFPSLSKQSNKQFFHWYKICLQLLPWLHVCGFEQKLDLYVFNFPCIFYGKAFGSLKKRLPSQLALRQLVLHRASGMPVGVALPNLQSLYLYRPDTHFRLSSDLSSLTELVLLDIEQLPLEQILSCVGRQLQKLSVVVMDILHLHRVFRMCPRLRVFHVPECPKQYIGLKEPLGDFTMSCLTELGLVQDLEKHGTESAVKTEELLQILQAAPNLRVLRLVDTVFSEQGGNEMCRALEEHSILQQLEQIFFFYEWPKLANHPDMIRIKKNCFSVLQCMNYCCPKLTTFELEDD